MKPFVVVAAVLLVAAPGAKGDPGEPLKALDQAGSVQPGSLLSDPQESGSRPRASNPPARKPSSGKAIRHPAHLPARKERPRARYLPGWKPQDFPNAVWPGLPEIWPAPTPRHR